ncbi:MAG: 2-octaprenyl-6-methoxyphenyl hydroxylase [Halieaceae bacterium]|jgi:2-octaprenyl-6-methoxyphenol hydroxylase|nr:2-octaprenyl-6-methoxyphenyl hydroxylase [Halieaceae bacterium]
MTAGSRKQALRIAIAGGGMVGISLALALRRALPDSDIQLIEAFPLAAGAPTTRYTPSFDARSTALSYGSALLYSDHGVWSTIAEHAQAIASIHVSERGHFGSTLMQASDYQWPALGYVVENAWLGRALLAALGDARIDTLSPASVTSATAGSPVQLRLDNGDRLETDLLVVADGARSGLREALGIESREQRYGEHAVIANIAHRKPHHGRAFERFTAEGPLAMLPLIPESSGSYRSALVWTRPPAEAAQMLEASEADFLAALQRAFGYRLGRLQQVGERHSYPLALVEAQEQVRSGIVVMGNAAHALHPVAGQGFNLALRDVSCLADTLAAAAAAGEDPSSLGVLQRYRERQAGDQARTTAFSDRLPGLFMQRSLALGVLRDAGLAALDIAPPLKEAFVRHTAGLAASADYRHARP